MHEITPDLLIKDCTVLSLRAQEQHAVAHSARDTQFLSIASMQLEALGNDADLKQALNCNQIIVTSPAAALFAGKASVFFIKENTSWFGLGPGTAAALKMLGVDHMAAPENGSDSESLLSLPALQKLQGQAIGLITAPGGRGLIEPELIKRGAKVHTAHVYQRKPVLISDEQLQQLEAIQSPLAILCSSYEVFQSFWQQAKTPLQEKLKHGMWVVSSARLQALLQKAGISNSTVSHSANAEAMLTHLKHVQRQQVR